MCCPSLRGNPHDGSGSPTSPLGTEVGTCPRTKGDRLVTVPNLQLIDPPSCDLPAPCSFGVHDWVTKRNDEHEDYQLCVRCGQRIE